ncbi:hypothetical protein BDB01DRAFT_849511 [Pilobolus umbonatus]|nr:hypothetical protein BDB01DRAFT_849511 [Pilobolus umbonatus]
MAAPVNEDIVKRSSQYAPQFHPIFPSLQSPGDSIRVDEYPQPWRTPDVYHDEVQAQIKAIDWQYVPEAPIRRYEDGHLVFDGYDHYGDNNCWWSSSQCITPTVNYLPQDLSHCGSRSEWGLTFDDGPINLKDENEEFALYEYLADEGVKSTLFYIGSNVLYFPSAARQALSHGNEICSHTWSHIPMTTLTNEQIVAELYWSIRAIKEATGVTTRCWRPPQGDVDDRVRAIAWQMGLYTVLWNRDSQDWSLVDSPDTYVMDSKLNDWIDQGENDGISEGMLVLQHELNHATLGMAQKWIPRIKKTFNIVPAMACNGVSPYW